MVKNWLGNWLGVLGFVLGILFLIAVFRFYDSCHPSTTLLPILIGILALVSCIRGLKRKKTNNISKIFSMIGLGITIFGSVFLLIFLVISINLICDGVFHSPCFDVMENLKINKIETASKTLVISIGSNAEALEIAGVKILINDALIKDVNISDLKPGDNKEIILESLKSRDHVEIAGVLGGEHSGMVCDISDSKTA